MIAGEASPVDGPMHGEYDGAGPQFPFNRTSVMRIDINQSGADIMTEVSALCRALKRDIADMEKMIENTNYTMSVAKLTLMHLELATDTKNWSKAS